MAAFDGEIDAASAADRDHLSGCSPCQQWLAELRQTKSTLDLLAYPEARVDLWAALEPRLRQSGAPVIATRRLWIIGACVIVWRVLQLWLELPLPVLHPLVPLAAVAAALWTLAGDPLAVRTFAPELQKRGI